MDILPLVLTEDMVLRVPADYFYRLAECSTPAVKMKIKEYLANEKAQEGVKEIIRAAYRSVFEQDKFLSDSVFMERVKNVSDLTYSSINNSVKTEDLEEWRDVLSEVFVSEFATPYIAPIEGILIESIIEDLSTLSEGNFTVSSLVAGLKNHKDLFRDGRTKKHVGTAMKRILLNEAKYRVILGGIEFLLEQRAKGQTTPIWRVL